MNKSIVRLALLKHISGIIYYLVYDYYSIGKMSLKKLRAYECVLGKISKYAHEAEDTFRREIAERI